MLIIHLAVIYAINGGIYCYNMLDKELVMEEGFNVRLERAYHSSIRVKKIDAMLEKLKVERSDLEDTANMLKERLAKEGYDVYKIENDKGIASFFRSVAGTQGEREEKEEKELVAARLKCNQAEKNLDSVDELISKLHMDRDYHEQYSKEYPELYARKKEELLRESGEAAKSILDLTEKINQAKAELKEITEARNAGEGVSGSLDGVLFSLGQAERQGVWDMRYNSIIPDIGKYRNIDDAKSQVEIAQKLLYSFKSELSDVIIDDELKIEISGLTKFADIFFDGFIIDWFVQQRIYDSQERVQITKDQVTRILGKLDQMQSEAKERITSLQKDLDGVIIGE